MVASDLEHVQKQTERSEIQYEYEGWVLNRWVAGPTGVPNWGRKTSQKI